MLSCTIPHFKWSSLGKDEVASTLFQGCLDNTEVEGMGYPPCDRISLPDSTINKVTQPVHFTAWRAKHNISSLLATQETHLIFYTSLKTAEAHAKPCVYTQQHWMKRPFQIPSWSLETQNFVANWKLTFASPLFSSCRAPGHSPLLQEGLWRSHHQL